MRIISGFAGGLRLAVPPQGTRPTSDRVREALFSALEARDALQDVRVLDLYAGSGALGLEAASRGAHTVVLVERDRRAAAVCRRNARMLAAARPAAGRAGPAITVHEASATAYLEHGAETADLVFLDPPYALAGDELTAVLTRVGAVLAADALVVIERDSRTGTPAVPAGWAPPRAKKYGETTLWWTAGPGEPGTAVS